MPTTRETFIDCPVCGKSQASKDCSYSDRGWHCFVCGSGGSLSDLARRTGAAETEVKLPPLPQIKRSASWFDHADKIMARLTAHPDRYRWWTSYKSILPRTIDLFDLGVGELDQFPILGFHTSRCIHSRITYPVRNRAGQVRAIRGRSLLSPPCCGDSWMSMAGSEVLLWEPATNGAPLPGPAVLEQIIICENPVDAMLAWQEGVYAVAGTGGAGTWRDEWTARLVELAPKSVVVWYDNDLAGCPNQETYWGQVSRWWDKMRQRQAEGAIKNLPPKAPEPNGPKVANRLLKAGIKARCFHWPSGTAPGYDLGALIEGR